MAKGTCKIEGCDGVHASRGWCATHYSRWRRHGDPLHERPTLAERFWAKVDVGAADECWPWRGTIDYGGYGRVAVATKKLDGVHRVAYALTNGPIPAGLDIDHTCHNLDMSCGGGPTCAHRRCCNPAHLEAVAHVINSQRGRCGAHLSTKTHCPAGHPYSGDNLIVHARGRKCRVCQRAAERRYRAGKA